jgi:NAD(P)-dependent dehydrogenase (short-subunit alcohol dehydrogenase family)
MPASVLISGAARGIGACVARHLAQSGFRVFAGVRKMADGDALCRGAAGQISPVLLDVADNASIDAAILEVGAQLGPGNGLQGLINNAGVYHGCPLQYLDVDEIRQIVEVNLLGSMLLTRAALPLLRTGNGRVLMHGSAMGAMTAPTISIYGATKAGMDALCEGLRLELGLVGVPVVLIEPGSVKSDLTAEGGQKLAKFLLRIPDADRRVYEPVLKRVVELSDPAHSGLEPIEVARVMERALTCKNPRARYRVGLAAKLAAALGHFPDRWVDGVQRKIFRVPAGKAN